MRASVIAQSGFRCSRKKCCAITLADFYTNTRAVDKKKPGVAALPASKHPDKKGVRDVSLRARRHRECERRTLRSQNHFAVERRVAKCLQKQPGRAGSLIELFKSSRATALDQKVAEFRIFDELRSSRCARADGCVEHCSNLHVTLKLHGTNPCAVSTKNLAPHAAGHDES